MFNTENYEIYELVNISAFILGLLFGIIAQKNQFCFSGSIKDYILTNSTKRAASVIMAILIAIVSTSLVSGYYNIDLTSTVYYKNEINYFAIILGGSLFGIGMILADGCSSRHLVKFAQGDSHSLITLLFIGIFAYAATKGFLNDLFNFVVSNEALISLSAKITNFQVSIYVLMIPLLIFLWLLTKNIKRIFSLKDGFLIGLIIAAGWIVTGILGGDSMEREIPLTSVTFVYPTAKTLELFTYYKLNDLSFGISVILGVVIGAFLMSKFNRRYSFGCTSNIKRNKLVNNMAGGALMGFGGVMSIGCTVGQGLTGLSTLAFASILAIASILGSGYLTALYLGKRDKLPMCFIFEWEDKKQDRN